MLYESYAIPINAVARAIPINAILGGIYVYTTILNLASAQDLYAHYNCTTPGQYAITFDDGPHPTQTVEILDLLKELNVKATFFIQGYNVWESNLTRYRETVKRTFEEGHQIANHGWSHPSLINVTYPEIVGQIYVMDYLIHSIIGVRPTLFRPPFGEYNQQVLDVAKHQFDYESIMWNIDTWDWSHPGNTTEGMKEYYDAIDTNLFPNYIALHHDVQDGAVELARTAIQFMRANGFEPVTVSECIGAAMYQ